MKIYHGSKFEIRNPRVNGSKAENDYGPAFYTTEDLQSANEWASRFDTIGFVNEYNINLSGLKILNLTNKDEYSILTWLAILMHFRKLDKRFADTFKYRLEWLEEKYYIDVTKCDVVIGFRADDAYFAFPLEFINGNITIEELEYIYNLSELGKQVVFISEKAIKKLKFVTSYVSKTNDIGKYKNRVKRAYDEFRDILKESMQKSGKRIGDLINDEH